jgi:hypothetical protein
MTTTDTIPKKVFVKDSILQKPKNQVIASKKDSTFSDTIKLKQKLGSFFSRKTASPKKAMLMSAIIPGAGQIYNKKGWAWRLPLCYGAYGGTIYYFSTSKKSYNYYYDIVKNYNTDKAYTNPKVTKSLAQTNLIKTRQQVEYAVLGMMIAHVYCIADAFVTAHLNQFDMDDNINLSVSPAGVGVSYYFSKGKNGFEKMY